VAAPWLVWMVAGCGGGTGVTTDPGTTAIPAPTCAGEADAALPELQATFDAVTAGVDPAPIRVVLDDGGNGSLQLGLHPGALAVLSGDTGVHVATTTIGKGRVVAFSGQDFLSSGDRSTLLGEPDVAQLLRNAASWAGGGGDSLSVLADNDAVGAVLTQGTGHSVQIPPVVESAGLRQILDWSRSSIRGHDVLVVQINEWGTLKVDDGDLPALHDFVADGGGLLIAGAALHWSWWLSDQGPAYPGDALLAEAGITWTRSLQSDLTGARLAFDSAATPEVLWCAYVSGDPVAAALQPRVAPLFVDAHARGRDAEVQAGLARLVAEAPHLPAAADRGSAKLAADVGAELHGVAWPAPHPWAVDFPGSVPDAAGRVAMSVRVDTTMVRSRPLGAYAAPGDRVTVTVPPEHAEMGLVLRVGDRYDDLRAIESIDTWNRAPRLYSTHPLTAAPLTVGTGMGGVLYLEVPDDFAANNVTVELEGVVPMAVFVQGQTTAAAFAGLLDAGAPRAIVGAADGIQMVVAAEAAKGADPEEVTAFWGPFYDSHADLAQEPAPRTYASHWLFDPQVGFGYANATPARIDFPELATGWALRTETGNEDWWLFGHEMGHQFQTSDWSGGDVTEVCVNLWSMVTLNGVIYGGGDHEMLGHRTGPVDHAALLGSTWGQADLFGKLELYRQLVDVFGWETVRQVMASYYDDAYPRSEYGSFMDGFALRFSAISGHDITPFLAAWDYPMSAETPGTVQSWALPEWLPPGW